MKIVSAGEIYDIYSESLKTYDQLPVKTYSVRCGKTGFYLEEHSPIEINETKIYGQHLTKIDKVINRYQELERNLGVILSGDKGIGKTLFAKLLSQEMLALNIPVIIVDTYYPGIANFIESIDQRVMVLFDEYEKTFAPEKEKDPSVEMLPLFDGVLKGNKLFVITCNNYRKLNEFLVNRPGRFHYHFRFTYPTPAEVKEYLRDKLKTEFYSEIDAVASFSNKVSLNYDCLRAIVSELNVGIAFKEAINDLNILNLQDERYRICVVFANGYMYRTTATLDMFSDHEQYISIYSQSADFECCFVPTQGKYDSVRNGFVYDSSVLTIDPDGSSDEKIFNENPVTEIIVQSCERQTYRYAL